MEEHGEIEEIDPCTLDRIRELDIQSIPSIIEVTDNRKLNPHQHSPFHLHGAFNQKQHYQSEFFF